MKNEHSYNLSEAVKTCYDVEPLRTDLSKTVTDKVFGGKRKTLPAFDRILLTAATGLIVGGVVWCISLLISVSLVFIFLAVLIFIIYFGLSVKEMAVFFKRMTYVGNLP